VSHKHIAFDTHARVSLQRGVDKLAYSVRGTLGPKGRYAVVDMTFGTPLVTNDGVTIARQIELDNVFENQGVQLVLQAATRTNDVAGDGTTTALILSQMIVREGLRNVAAGASPVLVREGMDKAVEAAVEEIKSRATGVTTREQVARIGAISSRSPEVGEVIADAIDQVGKDGVVSIQEGNTLGMEMDFVEGMHLDKGYVSPYFVTDQERMEAVLEDPYILMTDRKIGDLQEVLHIFDEVRRQGGSLLVMAEDVEGEALSVLTTNKTRGTFDAAAIRAPGFGERRKRMLEDIAILTGGEVITDERGQELQNTGMDQLGRAGRVVVTKNGTTLVDGAGDPEAVADRMSQIKNRLAVETAEFDREKLQERLARLAGGVAIIGVGAATEAEMREKKHRVEDALAATRAALAEGVVPGGGVALLHAQKAVGELIQTLDGDELTGARIIHRALEEPIRQIAHNAGADGSIVADKVRGGDGNVGYNALTGEYEDLVEAGVLDPTMVTRSALQHASSIGGLIVTTQAIVAVQPERGAAAGAAEVNRAGMNMEFM
jgi:chaperonin GroEL